MKNKDKKTYNEATLKLLIQYQDYKTKFHTKWGDQKRLDRLVGVEFRVKFMKAEQLFKAAALERIDSKTVKMIDMMYRAYGALEEEMQTLGYKPLEPHIRCFDWDGVIWYVTDLDYEIPRAMQRYKSEGKANLLAYKNCSDVYQKNLWI